jgi:hypothetical protein
VRATVAQREDLVADAEDPDLAAADLDYETAVGGEVVEPGDAMLSHG